MTRQPEPACVQRLRALLDASGAEYAILAHETAVVSAEDGVAGGFGGLEEMAPALVLKTKIGFLAAILGGERRISYKMIKQALGLKDVALAQPEEVQQITGAVPGAVSLVNPGMVTLVDQGLLQHERVYGGTGASGYTLCIRTTDLVRVTEARVLDFTGPKER